jgi:flagellar biosynthesis protein FlhB
MSDDHDQDSKTQDPTEKRLNESFEKGQFARSPELQVVATLAAALTVTGFALGGATRDLAALATGIWSNLPREAATPFDGPPLQIYEAARATVLILLPVVVAVSAATLLMGGFQSGFRLTPNALSLKFAALNPIAGFGRLVSSATLVRASIDFLKLLAVAGVLWLAARRIVHDPLFSAPVETAYLGAFLRSSTSDFLAKAILGLGIVAAIGYGYEKHKTHRDMMMSHEEVKEEHKQSEGDAHTKAAMKRMARRLMQKQMLAAVPTADVVVTNPTHYAVALKYERGRDAAPIVLAKGENHFARRIKALAASHGVPTVENKPIARLLFAVGKVGESIPGELYQAVAEILAFVYRTQRLYFHDLKLRRAILEAAAGRKPA